MIDQDRKDLSAYLAGDAAAAKALIARYSAPLVNHASYMLSGDRFMAEDLVQNSFLKLWQNAEKLLASDQPLQLRAWLFRVLRNQCLDELKRNRSDDLDAAGELRDGAPMASENLEHQDRAAFVMGLIGRLPERQKSALLMAHFEGMSNPDIALVMECTVEAVENLLARARRSLKTWAQQAEVII